MWRNGRRAGLKTLSFWGVGSSPTMSSNKNADRSEVFFKKKFSLLTPSFWKFYDTPPLEVYRWLGGSNLYAIKLFKFFDYLTCKSYKTFFFNPSTCYFNINCINLLILGSTAFNNFFFYLFNQNWLKNFNHARKFLLFLQNAGVKNIFFFWYN